MIDELDPSKYSFSEKSLQDLEEGKVEYLVWDDFITTPNLLGEARLEAESIQADMKDAGFGKTKQNDKNVRSDKLMWITDRTEGPLFEISCLHEKLRPDPLSTGKETQLALYPGAQRKTPAHYLRHRDAVKQDLNNREGNQRVLTVITYMN
jgi:hypothetical protein